MSKQAAEHHKRAAEHHEHAVRHHKEAAKHHEADDYDKAAHHAHVAHAHLLAATAFSVCGPRCADALKVFEDWRAKTAQHQQEIQLALAEQEARLAALKTQEAEAKTRLTAIQAQRERLRKAVLEDAG